VSFDRALLFDLILYLAMRPHHTFPRGAKLSDESDTWLLETVGTFTDDGGSLTEASASCWLCEEAFRQAMEAWLPRVGRGRSHTTAKDPRGIGDTIHDENANVLRGFLWLLPLLKRRDGDARLAAAVAFSAYRKVPGVGPRAVKVGNAAVYALSEMVGPEAMGQLAMLKVRVRFGTAKKEVEKAFDAAARELQLPREEIEELSVPDCGLTSGGVREDALGGYRVRVGNPSLGTIFRVTVIRALCLRLRWSAHRSKEPVAWSPSFTRSQEACRPNILAST
jgi:hypothetical protein